MQFDHQDRDTPAGKVLFPMLGANAVLPRILTSRSIGYNPYRSSLSRKLQYSLLVLTNQISIGDYSVLYLASIVSSPNEWADKPDIVLLEIRKSVIDDFLVWHQASQVLRLSTGDSFTDLRFHLHDKLIFCGVDRDELELDDWEFVDLDVTKDSRFRDTTVDTNTHCASFDGRGCVTLQAFCEGSGDLFESFPIDVEWMHGHYTH